MTNKAVTNFFIYSPPKTGSTALFYNLSQHPEMSRCSKKEPHFFSGGFHEDKIVEYNSLFKFDNKLKFEASTTYFWHKEAIVRIKKYCDNPKLIIVLRNPVDRFISEYKHFRAINIILNNESLKNDFENSINWKATWLEGIKTFKGISKNNHKSIQHILLQGEYIIHLKNIFDHIDRHNVLIINYNDYKNNFADTINKICSFLDIDSSHVKNNKIMNKTEEWQKWANVEDEISTEMITDIENLYKPYNQQLEEYLGVKLDWN